MLLDDKLKSLGQFLSTLTWEKIAQLIALVIIIVVTWTMYKMSDRLIEYVRQDKIENRAPSMRSLSTSTINDINRTASKSGIMAGVAVSVVNFQKNTGYLIYINGYTRELKEEFSRHNLNSVELPAFTQNAMQNRRLIDLINGEFTCYDFSTTLLATQMPLLQDKISYACSSSIPPYYGKFVGTVTIFLKRVPTAEEIDQLRVMSNILSEIIYNKELK